MLSTYSPSSSATDNVAKKSKKTQAATKSQQADIHFTQWKEVSVFIADMVAKHGFQDAELNAMFEQARYIETARQLMRPAPPGKPKNWKAYRARFVEPYRIDAGVAFWNKNADLLARAEQQYGVPAEIIVGLIGVETIYGKNTGSFRAMDVLTTLAFDYPETPTRETRMQFFRSELENLLVLAKDSGADPFAFKGSYAGAIGLPQFMPGSIRQYAVDFDGDGKINLNESTADAIGSVANYLSLHGWKRNLPTVFPATLNPSDENQAQLKTAISRGLRATYTLNDLKGFLTTPSSDAPDGILYGVIDLQNGEDSDEYWLGSDNFFAITQYNRSYFYAMSVIDLGRVISAARQN
ncbi:lytic murein transglycosylase B [Undibacterium sp. SXout11W]|uniref:lytic murein transglycosylase B n=1 Tax=Undibacterium sp. SXout11W TaxID=3413050 RepID=UPI003BEF714E